MLVVRLSQDCHKIKEIVTHPDLFELSGHAENPKTFNPDMAKLWMEINLNNEIVGFFQFEQISKVTLSAHMYLLPKCQGRGLAVKAINEALKVLKDLHILRVAIFVPVSCVHIHKLLKRTKAKICGSLQDSIIYKNKLQPLIIYEVEV